MTLLAFNKGQHTKLFPYVLYVKAFKNLILEVGTSLAVQWLTLRFQCRGSAASRNILAEVRPFFA